MLCWAVWTCFNLFLSWQHLKQLPIPSFCDAVFLGLLNVTLVLFFSYLFPQSLLFFAGSSSSTWPLNFGSSSWVCHSSFPKSTTLPRPLHPSAGIQLWSICWQQIFISNPGLSLEWQIIYLVVSGLLHLGILKIPHVDHNETGTPPFPLHFPSTCHYPTISINSAAVQPSAQAGKLAVMFEPRFPHFSLLLSSIQPIMKSS